MADSEQLSEQNTETAGAGRALIAAALAMAATGAIFYNLLPLTLGVAQDDRGLADSEIGLLGASFFVGFNIISASSYFWMHRLDARRLATAAIIIGVCSLALSARTTFLPMLALTALAGGAFSLLYSLAATIIGETAETTRWFGVKITLEALLGALLVLILPGTLVAAYGYDGLIAGIIIAVLVLSPFVLLLRRVPEPGLPEPLSVRDASRIDTTSDGASPMAAIVALVAAGSFFGGQTTVWAFVERMGADAGFTQTALAGLLIATLISAVLGSLTAAVLGYRFGNVTPFLCACGLFFIGALTIASSGATFLLYAAGASIITYSVGLGIAFAVAEVARLDANGRFVIFSVPAVGIGAMLGPGIAGFLADTGGYGAVLAFGALTVGLAMILLPLASRRRHPATVPGAST